MDIKVTVILPSYNVEEYIEQCLQSVMDQTLKDIEILCIDAGSTDRTWQRIERLAANDPRVRMIKAEKKSYGYQMNLGIREAKGEYIGIVETDDYVDPDTYELLYNATGGDGADISKAGHIELYEYEDGSRIELPIDYVPEGIRSGETLSPDDHPDIHNWDSNIWNGIYRREFLLEKKIGFQETPGAAFQDIAFQQMVLNEAEKVVYSRFHIYHYRRNRPGASTWNPRCVGFVHTAYSELLADPRTKDDRLKYLYIRMVRAFFTEYRKTLCYDNDMTDGDSGTDTVKWFEDRFREALKEGLFVSDELWELERTELSAFLSDREMYTRKIREYATAVFEWTDELKAKSRGRKIVLFGAGRYGMMLLPFLIKNSILVDGLADNQIGLANNSFFGMRVINADEAVRSFKDGFYVIAGKAFGKEIRDQLKIKGIPEDNIILFDGSNVNLMEGIRRFHILPIRKS